MRYVWQPYGTGQAQLLDTLSGQVVHRGNPPTAPVNSDDPRQALAGLRNVRPPDAGSAWVNDIGQLFQRVGTDDLYYIDGELYERLANGSYFKVPAQYGLPGWLKLALFATAAWALFQWMKR